MKKLTFTLLFMFAFMIISKAQIVITEIMYNSPDAGFDSIEYIEIHNPFDIEVDISNYAFSQGVDHTFSPGTLIPAGGYMVVTNDATAFTASFGGTPVQWSGGGLSNGGEDIAIINALGNTVDSVDYMDGGDWPTDPDGFGPSLELCDPDVDNLDPANWKASTNATGVIFEGTEVLGTPGDANSATCGIVPDHTIQLDGILFIPSSLTINVGETVEWVWVSGFHNVDGNTTDYPGNPEGFTSGDPVATPNSYTFTFNTPGVYDYHCDVHLGANMVGQITVLDEPAIPIYPIGQVSTVDADGVADSLDVVCQIQGVVYGINLRPGGYSFTIIDEFNDGINVFGFNEVSGYSTITEGDEIIVIGTIDQFSGLLEIVPDSISIASSANSLFDPTVVAELGEATESQLVRINGVSLVTPSQWTGDGSSFNADITDGVGTFVLRVDSDVTDLANSAPPTGTFDVIGIGGQFDGSSPFTEGYQIFPRYQADVIPIVSDVVIAFSDMAETNFNEPVTFEVLNNDVIPNDITDFSIVDDPTNGMAVINMDNTITYTPNMDFCGSDSLTYAVCDAGSCDTTSVSIIVNCQVAYPLYSIGTVTTVDAEGVVDSAGVECEIRGVVYGINLRPDGLQFFMVDKDNKEDGIGLFSGSENFGYTVAEGDEIAVQGVISQFSGLSQINPVSIELLSSGNTLFDPDVVTAMDESTESKLIKFENMTIVDAGQWTNSGSGFNVDITDGTNMVQIRIDADVELYGGNPIEGIFNVIGIGAQFDSNAPFDSGYQLLPRYSADIEVIINTRDLDIKNSVQYYPNPTTSKLQVVTEGDLDKIQIHNLLGQKVIELINPGQFESIEMGSFAAGIYSISFKKDYAVWTSKLIVE